MVSIGGDLTTMKFTPLGDELVELLRQAGRERRFAAGEIVLDAGQPHDRIFYVEDGEIEVVDPMSGGRKLESTLGPRQFTGEIGLRAAPPRRCRCAPPSRPARSRSSAVLCWRRWPTARS